eukprot:CAMPEP_0194061454 /NCGR_PEP_ID=MMETSP0009_2-20130614/74644_1 /TAXON_ID=210454 /ORGANISM="Grammatophora oceanica, Strain CCMP 410" /LENGTH=50 /DNA_ID=CAMNT_0038712763 /DNA_START=1 /DNA_END=150 /DNA_ORIENTATION=-
MNASLVNQAIVASLYAISSASNEPSPSTDELHGERDFETEQLEEQMEEEI